MGALVKAYNATPVADRQNYLEVVPRKLIECKLANYMEHENKKESDKRLLGCVEYYAQVVPEWAKDLESTFEPLNRKLNGSDLFTTDLMLIVKAYDWRSLKVRRMNLKGFKQEMTDYVDRFDHENQHFSKKLIF